MYAKMGMAEAQENTGWVFSSVKRGTVLSGSHLDVSPCHGGMVL